MHHVYGGVFLSGPLLFFVRFSHPKRDIIRKRPTHPEAYGTEAKHQEGTRPAARGLWAGGF